jgi:hypothetical protein
MEGVIRVTQDLFIWLANSFRTSQQSRATYNASNTAETIDTDLAWHELLFFFSSSGDGCGGSVPW